MAEPERNSIAFPQLSEEQLAAIKQFAASKSFSDGDILFAAGDCEFKFFVIETGQVEIVEQSSGQRKTVTVHCEKEFTGDVDMLTGKPSLVTAIAKGNCEIYEISANDLRRILKEIPKLGDCILQAFISRRRLLEASGFAGLQVVGSRFSRDTLRIKDFLAKNKIPFTWIDLEVDDRVDALLKQFDISEVETPVVTCSSNLILKNPSNQKLGEVAGIKKPIKHTVYDLAIVGAGPAGLAAAVYGASEGLKTIVLEKIAPGGQAGSSSRIENYMGFPTGLSGTDLAERAVLQAQKFGTLFSTPTEVVGLEFENAYHVLQLTDGDRVSSRSVLIATGASYRKLKVEGCDQFEGTGVYYSATAVEAQICRDSQIIVVGGANSAGQAAAFLSNYAKQVLLLIRGDDLSKDMSQYLLRRIEQTDNIKLLKQTEISKMMGEESLQSIELKNNQTEETQIVEAAAVFVFIGATPRTNWLPKEVDTDDKGFIKTGLQVADSKHWTSSRQPFLLETSRAGIFAAGDVRLGSTKRVASAVGEGSMTVQFVHEILSR